METTFCELKGKEVINIVDGKRLGRIIDLVFETNCGKVLGLVVPCYNKSWNIFKASEDIFIPFGNVCKIGDDVILVQIYVPNRQQVCGARKRTKAHSMRSNQSIETQGAFSAEQPTVVTNNFALATDVSNQNAAQNQQHLSQKHSSQQKFSEAYYTEQNASQMRPNLQDSYLTNQGTQNIPPFYPDQQKP